MHQMKKIIKQTVRQLRRKQTESERKIWEVLRNRKLMGKKFLRQHPIVFNYCGKERFLITDFCCCEEKLIIEIGGEIHNSQKNYDEDRENVLRNLGFKIIRFTNKEIESNTDETIEKLTKTIGSYFTAI